MHDVVTDEEQVAAFIPIIKMVIKYKKGTILYLKLILLNSTMPRNIIELDEESLQKYFDLCDSDELNQLTNKAKRTEILHFKYGFRKCHLIRLGECTKRIFERMVASHNKGEEVGVRGRPSYISAEDQEKLKTILENKAHSGIPLTGRELSNYVCNYLFTRISIYVS